jgi:hypothetical protein
VSRQSICVPKKEGDLGLKRIEDWNKAAILKHNNIWLQNNCIIFGGQVKSEESIMKAILWIKK